MYEQPSRARTAPFSVTIIGYYTSGPDVTDVETAVAWKSERAVKRLAELEVLRVGFEEWYAKTKAELSEQV